MSRSVRFLLVGAGLAAAVAGTALVWRAATEERSDEAGPASTTASRPAVKSPGTPRAATASRHADPPSRVVLLVRDPQTREPAAGAEVSWWVESARADEPARSPASAGRATSDAAGRVAVDAPADVRAIVIAAAGRWSRWVRPADGPVPPVIEFVPTPQIAVRTVLAGRPVPGVTVALCSGDRQSESTIATAVTSGPDAIALLDVLRRAGGRAGAPWRIPGQEDRLELFVSVIAPLAERLRVPFSLDPLPSAPVEISLPAGGEVVVRLIDAAGNAWTGPTVVSIAPASAGTPASGFATASAQDGFARFPFVGLGLDLTLAWRPEIPAPPDSPSGTAPRRFVSATSRIAGPVTAGQVVSADLRTSGPRPVAVGRLVDDAGRPVSRHGLTGQLFGARLDASQRPPSDPATTADDGRFALSFDADVPESDGLLRISSAGTGDGRQAQMRELARLPWTRANAERIDAGDIVLGTPPSVVSGRIVAESGIVLQDATVWIARRRLDRWQIVGDLRATTDLAGRFDVRGTLPGDERLWVLGGAQGMVLDEPCEFRPGATEVLVRLLRTGSVEGSVLVPRDIDPGSAIEVTIEGEAARTGAAGSGDLSPVVAGTWSGERFLIDGLRPGHGTVVLRTAAREDPLARVEGVAIAPGGRTRDPRLAGLDLRRLVTVTTVRVTDADGKPLAGAVVWSRAAAPPGTTGNHWAQGLTGADGLVRRAGFGVPLDVVAAAPGRVPGEAHQVGSAATVELQSARPSEVVVRLAEAVEMPAAPLALEVRLVWCGTAERPIADPIERNTDPRSIAHIQPLPFGRARTVRFEVAEPGRWQAMLVVQRHDAGGGRGQGMTPLRSTEVVVTTSPQKLEIVADVDPELYAAVCRELSK